MIDLRANNNSDNQKRLIFQVLGNVTYDDSGKTFWNLQLDFDNGILVK